MATKSVQRFLDKSLEGVLEELRQGHAASCYLLYGEEEYLLNYALDRILEALLPSADRDLNLFTVEGDKEDIALLCETLITAPLFPSKKVVLVRNTRLFQPRQTTARQAVRIREQTAKDPLEAARSFLALITAAGWSIEDFKDEGWKRIPAEDLGRVFGGNTQKEYEGWLPGLVDVCITHKLAPGKTEAGVGTEMLEKLLKEGLPEHHHLILTAETIDRRKSLFKIIHASGRVVEFMPAKGTERQKQVIMAMAGPMMADRKKIISPAAWLALERKTGLELRPAMAAIEKLIAYTGDRQSIEANDIDEVVGKTKEDRLFDLTAAIASKDLEASLRTMRDLFGQGEQALLILAMIGREIRFLLHAHILHRTKILGKWRANMDFGTFQNTVYPKIRELADAAGNGTSSLIGQHPFVIFQVLKDAKAFGFESLVGHLDRLVEVDLAIKTTAQDPVILLEQFLIRVCS
jgi:DNA polymerase-3 subunit delta